MVNEAEPTTIDPKVKFRDEVLGILRQDHYNNNQIIVARRITAGIIWNEDRANFVRGVVEKCLFLSSGKEFPSEDPQVIKSKNIMTGIINIKKKSELNDLIMERSEEILRSETVE